MHGVWPDNDIDHKNRNRADNRLNNLREATRSENLHNSPSRGLSGVKGVSLLSPSLRKKSKKVWRAAITINYTTHFLGTFTTFEDAVAARRNAEAKLLRTDVLAI